MNPVDACISYTIVTDYLMKVVANCESFTTHEARMIINTLSKSGFNVREIKVEGIKAQVDFTKYTVFYDCKGELMQNDVKFPHIDGEDRTYIKGKENDYEYYLIEEKKGTVPEVSKVFKEFDSILGDLELISSTQNLVTRGN